jgi:hypothetical protein
LLSIASASDFEWCRIPAWIIGVVALLFASVTSAAVHLHGRLMVAESWRAEQTRLAEEAERKKEARWQEDQHQMQAFRDRLTKMGYDLNRPLTLTP